jgi:hypothetical protein
MAQCSAGGNSGERCASRHRHPELWVTVSPESRRRIAPPDDDLERFSRARIGYCAPAMTHDHHGHDHHHHHAGAATGSTDRAFAIGLALNIAFVAVEAYAGFAADSLALLADAGHNLGDVLGLALAWAAVWAGRRRPSRRWTYGFGRSSIIAALINAVVLLIAVVRGFCMIRCGALV